jgi:hypothetical protein
MRFFNIILSIISILFLFSACQSSRQYLKAHSDVIHKRKKVYDEHLLVKNNISINQPKKFDRKNKVVICTDSVLIYPQSYKLDSDLANKLQYDLNGMIRQKPNRVVFFTRPFLWLYNVSDTLRVKYRYDKNFRWERERGEWIQGGIKADTINKHKNSDTLTYKPRKLRKFFMNKIGEPPVIYDSVRTALSAKSMQNHLMQKGFLDAKVGYKVKFKKHKAYVEYHYSTGKPLLIDTVIFDSDDPAMKMIMAELKPASELKKGMPMDKSAFLKERTRLTSEIRNRGYYSFNWNYISYIADTANAAVIPEKINKGIFGKTVSSKIGEQGEKRVQIYINISSPKDSIKFHTKFTIRDVFIVLDEPKVEIHKIRRKYLMDSSFVVLRPPRKEAEISNIYRGNYIELDSTIYLTVTANEGLNILSEIKKANAKSIILVESAKKPYWLTLKALKTNGQALPKAILEELDDNKIRIVFPSKRYGVFGKSSSVYRFSIQDPNDGKSYSVELKPYKRSFISKAYSKLSDVDEEDIPIHIILRKPAISPLTDSLEKAKDVAELKKKNFIIYDHVISQLVDIKIGSLYNYEAGRVTVNKISELEIFRIPRVEYVPSKSGATDELDAYVFMQKAKQKLLGAETDFNTTSSGTNLGSNNSNLGWALNLNIKNRNVFKGAEVFLFNIEGGINFDPRRTNASSNVQGIVSWIDLLNINSSLNLFFPKIAGFRNWSLSVEKPKTRASIAYHYLQQSIDFRVSSFDALFGFDWQTKKGVHRYSWNPFMLNFTLKPILDPAFEIRLRESNFALWASLNEQFFLPGTNFNYIFTPKLKNDHNVQLRIFAETTGNTAFLTSLITRKEIQLFQTPYSQYTKADIDLRYTYKFSRKHIFASRIMAGAAIPLASTVRVPYSRQFFVGGPSSMRGWNMRQLGPGRMRSDENTRFQLGDIRLEMNAEYRFMLNSWIGSALFVDAGNIWYARSYENTAVTLPYSNLESGVFNENFINEMALSVGSGLRLDLSFFVLRFDFGVPIRDPSGFSRTDDNGFVHYTNESGFPIYWKFDWRNTNFLLAVGYPF